MSLSFPFQVTKAGAGTKQAPAFPQSSSSTGLDAHHPFMARINCVRELHGKGSDRSCVHVEVDVSGSKISYEHGDHVAVHAQNSAAVVDEVVAMLGHGGAGGGEDVIVTLRRPPASSPNAAACAGLAPAPFSGPLSLRQAVAFFPDVLSSPHKEV